MLRNLFQVMNLGKGLWKKTPLKTLCSTFSLSMCRILLASYQRVSSYNWVGSGVIGGTTSCIHGRCREWRVGLRFHCWWAGTQRRTNSYTGQTFRCVFYCLSSCDKERERENEKINQCCEDTEAEKSWAWKKIFQGEARAKHHSSGCRCIKDKENIYWYINV